MSSDAYPIESNGFGESGGGLSTSGGHKDHGWQKVTNLKKQRRQAARSVSGGEKSEIVGGDGKSDSKAFQALETEAEERRARRKAKLEAAAAAAAASGGEVSHSGEEDSDSDGGKADGVKENGEVKKSKPKKPKKPKVTVEQAASAITVDGLTSFLSEISESFAALPDIQLMRLADYFARVFNPVTNAQFTWNKILRDVPIAKSVEIPLCYVSEEVVKVTSDWLAQKPADALSKFSLWLLKEILDEPHPQQQHHKGSKVVAAVPAKAKVGVIVILALLLRKKPETLLQQAAAVRAQFSGQEKLHTLAWAYCQASQGDLVVGTALWVQNLLPLAVGKSSTPASRDIALQVIENLLFTNTKKARTVLLNGATRKGERLVPPASYELVLRAAYPNESAKTKATERFLAIYPFIKEIALAGTFRSRATKPVAQQLLPLSLAGAADDVTAISTEACGNFVWCLAQNPDCYKQWERLHLENLKGSIQILNHINSDWKETSVRLAPLDDLKKTLQALSSKHHNGLESVQGDAVLESQLKAADSVCKALLRKTSRVPSCTKAVATLAAIGCLGYGFYLISPSVNPWNWDGKLLLSKTHSFI